MHKELGADDLDRFLIEVSFVQMTANFLLFFL